LSVVGRTGRILFPEPECYPQTSMIRLELQPEVEAQLAAEAQARGLALDQYVEKIVEARPVDAAGDQARTHSVAEAIERILELREGTSLGGLKIRDLIDEGRKY